MRLLGSMRAHLFDVFAVVLERAVRLVALPCLGKGAADWHAVLVILVQEAARVAAHAQPSQPVCAHRLQAVSNTSRSEQAVDDSANTMITVMNVAGITCSARPPFAAGRGSSPVGDCAQSRREAVALLAGCHQALLATAYHPVSKNTKATLSC